MKLAPCVVLATLCASVAWGQSPAAAEPEKRLAAASSTSAAQAEEFFETKIRPVLATNCFVCHTDAQSGGLRVDSRESLLKGGTSGPAFVPGDPDKSLLIQAVRQTGELKMPKGGHLKKAEIDDLSEWVKIGAPWPAAKAILPAVKSPAYQITPEQRAFWSFQPLHDPAIPTVKDKSWPRTPIDNFVLAKLETENLKPVKFATRRALIRRASLDLIGLPPAPEEIEAFENDKSPDAFAKVVDRLLASPRYGERWGRHWLDVVRYAEDDVRGLDPKQRGYMPFRGAYLFRDWVIQAFNDDMPYDVFTKAQIAGDYMDPSVREKMLPATAMLGQGPWWWDQADPAQGRADERNERIDLITRGFLGLTVACARCHNHKYDPIPQKDYYSLVGVFANTNYKEYPVQSPAHIALYEKKQKQIDDLEEVIEKFTEKAVEQQEEITAHKTSKYLMAAWKVTGEPKMQPAQAAAEEHVDLEMLERWIKLLARAPKHYPYLRDWQAMIKTGGTQEQAQFLADDFQRQVLSVLAEWKELKEENDIIKAKAGVKKKPRRDAYPSEFETKDQFCPGCDLELKTGTRERTNLFLDLFAVDLDSENDQIPDPGRFVVKEYGLERHLSPEAAEYLAGLKTELEALKKALPEQYPFIHGASDAEKIQNTKVNLRGSPYNLGDEVPRHFLSVLSPGDPVPFAKGSGRMELAESIVQSPIAARVIVNRVWAWHMGTGIVNTPSNFGTPGERPTNPELLEYLAKSLVDNGMSIKKLHRQILLSSVYQLGTDDSEANSAKDPANRLYWRANRRRLDAEAIRDSILFVSGALDLKKTAGPSTDFGDDNFRRTVFCKVSRYRLDNYLQVFDFPNPSFTAEQRFVTNVPLQRLFFMNSSFVYKQAERLARRVYDEADDTARIRKAYLLLYGRPATDAEIQAGIEYLRAVPEKPGQQIAGEPPTAWREYARVLLSANEFEFVN
jgi:mono/diheme cytochrome c family protein